MTPGDDGYNLPSISWFSIIETRFALTAVLFLTHCLEMDFKLYNIMRYLYICN
jgi:hypothetical protein